MRGCCDNRGFPIANDQVRLGRVIASKSSTGYVDVPGPADDGAERRLAWV